MKSDYADCTHLDWNYFLVIIYPSQPLNAKKGRQRRETVSNPADTGADEIQDRARGGIMFLPGPTEGNAEEMAHKARYSYRIVRDSLDAVRQAVWIVRPTARDARRSSRGVRQMRNAYSPKGSFGPGASLSRYVMRLCAALAKLVPIIVVSSFPFVS